MNDIPSLKTAGNGVTFGKECWAMRIIADNIHILTRTPRFAVWVCVSVSMWKVENEGYKAIRKHIYVCILYTYRNIKIRGVLTRSCPFLSLFTRVSVCVRVYYSINSTSQLGMNMNIQAVAREKIVAYTENLPIERMFIFMFTHMCVRRGRANTILQTAPDFVALPLFESTHTHTPARRAIHKPYSTWNISMRTNHSVMASNEWVNERTVHIVQAQTFFSLWWWGTKLLSQFLFGIIIPLRQNFSCFFLTLTFSFIVCVCVCELWQSYSLALVRCTHQCECWHVCVCV